MQLAAALNKSNCQVNGANELGVKAEETTSQMHSILQKTERDKKVLQQEVRNLTGTTEIFRQTISNSVDEFLNRLRLDLNLSVSGCGEDFVRASLDDIQGSQ